MPKLWTDAPKLYIHFMAFNGCFASLRFNRVSHIFEQEVKGAVGAYQLRLSDQWIVPGYKCAGCGRTFFTPEPEGLRHECCKHTGLVSDHRSMGVLDGVIE